MFPVAPTTAMMSNSLSFFQAGFPDVSTFHPSTDYATILNSTLV